MTLIRLQQPMCDILNVSNPLDIERVRNACFAVFGTSQYDRKRGLHVIKNDKKSHKIRE